jgi:hypothetical protein
MHQIILKWRDLPLVDFLPDFLAQLYLFLPGVIAPVRENQMFPPLIHIVGRHPGGGRDPTVPGPGGLIGVAVEAGALQDRKELLGPCNFSGYRRVAAIDRDQLDGGDENDQEDKNFFRFRGIIFSFRDAGVNF